MSRMSYPARRHPEATLPATAYAVLGLLSFGRELSGYDLKKWADSILRFFYWAPAVSQIYGELKRLDRLGYVSSREVPQDELRNKRVYRITDDGPRRAHRVGRADEVEPPVLKHSPPRVWLGHLAVRRAAAHHPRVRTAHYAARCATTRNAAWKVRTPTSGGRTRSS